MVEAIYDCLALIQAEPVMAYGVRMVIGKYDPLRRYLEQLTTDIWDPKFADIEKILESRLPKSARTYEAWWANDWHHSHASAWLNTGWRTENLNLTGERITFRRVSLPRAPRSEKPRSVSVALRDKRAVASLPFAAENSGPEQCRFGFRWNGIGRIALGGDARLIFPKAEQGPGIYRFQVRAGARRSLYIGQSDNVARRFQHYRCPGPTQATNIRINAMFRDALAAGAEIGVATMAEAWIEHGDSRKQADFSSKAMRCLFENAALTLDEGDDIDSLNR